MANEENLKGHGFHERTASEQREIAVMGGKASGESRRRKADFRKTLNALLTAEIDSPEWTPMLEALGLDSTMESVINAAMIKEALNGDVRAYTAIRDTLGQTTKAEIDLEEQRIKMELNKARKQAVTGENETDEALSKLDKILKEVRDNAAKQQTE